MEPGIFEMTGIVFEISKTSLYTFNDDTDLPGIETH